MAPLPTTEDYYGILDVNQNASIEEVKTAYRQLALREHPDRGGSTAAFQKLGEAYETLSDPSKRRKYDLLYPNVPRRPPSTRRSQTSQTNTNLRSDSEEMDDELAQIIRIEARLSKRRAEWERERRDSQDIIDKLKQIVQNAQQEVDELTRRTVYDDFEKEKENSLEELFVQLSLKHTPGDEEEKKRKERKEIERQERSKQASRKAEQLKSQRELLREKEKSQREAEDAIYKANSRDHEAIRVLGMRSTEKTLQRLSEMMQEMNERRQKENGRRQQESESAHEKTSCHDNTGFHESHENQQKYGFRPGKGNSSHQEKYSSEGFSTSPEHSASKEEEDGFRQQKCEYEYQDGEDNDPQEWVCETDDKDELDLSDEEPNQCYYEWNADDRDEYYDENDETDQSEYDNGAQKNRDCQDYDGADYYDDHQDEFGDHYSGDDGYR